jgi:hypothetical protein
MVYNRILHIAAVKKKPDGNVEKLVDFLAGQLIKISVSDSDACRLRPLARGSKN